MPAEASRSWHPTLSRRLLLAGAAACALLLPVAAAKAGEPFADGTWFDDGTGWVS